MTDRKPKKQGTKAKKRPRIYLAVREVVDVATGKRCLGLLAEDDIQRSAMRERGFKKGMRVACDVHPERDIGQWRKSHLLGRLLVDNVEGFEQLDAHRALKKIQVDGDIECDHEAMDFPGLGPIQVRRARSLAFDEMGQDDFDRVFLAMCRHIGAAHFAGLDEQAVLEMLDLMPVDTP